MYERAMRPLTNFGPGVGEVQNPRNCTVDFQRELISEIGALLIVVFDCIDPLLTRFRKERNRHE